MVCSGANVGSIIGNLLGVGQAQRGAAELDGKRDALRRRHGSMAVDRLGVIPVSPRCEGTSSGGSVTRGMISAAGDVYAVCGSEPLKVSQRQLPSRRIRSAVMRQGTVAGPRSSDSTSSDP